MANTYVLVICCKSRFDTDVGSLGSVGFDKGWYGYVGSSRSENFSRLSRHQDVSDGSNETRHWHVDYLIGADETEIYGAFTTTDTEECNVAQSVDTGFKKGFGCSDCDCRTHLRYDEEVSDFAENTRSGIEELTTDFTWMEHDEF